MAVKQSVKEFKSTIATQLDTTAKEYDLDLATEHGRGRAFQYWVGDVILSAEGNLDTDLIEAALYSKDLGTDLVFEDEANKAMLIAQCKYVTLQGAVQEGQVNDFFHRHDHYMDRRWVQKYGSEYANSALGDYADRIEDGWKVEYRFVTTGAASERVREVVEHVNVEYSRLDLPIECTLYDFSVLKDYYVRSLSLEASIPSEVVIDLPAGQFFEKDQPYPTLIAVLKGNSLRALYQQHKQSLYAWNIRGYLGNRGINEEIAETARDEPGDFFYFNNGVSAICTDFRLEGNRLVAESMQIINGAQTVSSLAGQRPDPNIEVLFRLTRTQSVKTDKGLNQRIIRFNNSQNAVKLSDFRSNDSIHMFLESRVQFKRAKGALPALHYLRKRSVGRKGLGTGIKLEDFAKIRYSFLYEPTLVHASPKALWTLKEDGGVYEKAFGVGGELEDVWSDETLEQALLAVAFYFRISQDAKDQAKKNADLKFLNRLRFHGLSLAGSQFAELASAEIAELLHNRPQFEETFDNFWPTARSALITVQSMAEDEDMTMFAFVRSGERWAQMKKLYGRQMAVR